MTISTALLTELHTLVRGLISATPKPICVASKRALLDRMGPLKTFDPKAARRLLFLFLEARKTLGSRTPSPFWAALLAPSRLALCGPAWDGLNGSPQQTRRTGALALCLGPRSLRVGLWTLDYREQFFQKMIDISLNSPLFFQPSALVPSGRWLCREVSLVEAYRLSFTSRGEPLGLSQRVCDTVSVRVRDVHRSLTLSSYLLVKRPAPQAK